jgi:hypothetical protein
MCDKTIAKLQELLHTPDCECIAVKFSTEVICFSSKNIDMGVIIVKM